MANNNYAREVLSEYISSHLSRAEIASAEIMGLVSAAIIKYRAERDWNQKEMAEFMDVSQSMISKWESGMYNFTIFALTEICEKLEISLSVALGKQRTEMQTASRTDYYTLSSPAAYNVSRAEQRPQNRLELISNAA